MKEYDVTSQPQTTSGPAQNKDTADGHGTPKPLDRSSEEWRSQFGVLPSARLQSVPTRPGSGQSRGIVPPGTPSEAPRKKNYASFLAAAAGIIVVGGLIAYGYLPSQQAGRQKKGDPKVSKTAAASAVPAKKPRQKAKAATARPPVIARKAVPPARRAAAVPGKKIVKTAVKSPVKAAPVTRRPATVSLAPASRPVQAPGARKPPVTPRPRKAVRKPPVVRKVVKPVPAAAPVQAAAAVPATPRPKPKAAAPAPRVKAPVPKAVVPTPRAAAPRPVAQPSEKPVAPPLPAAPRPKSGSIESDGTNPLGLPR